MEIFEAASKPGNELNDEWKWFIAELGLSLEDYPALLNNRVAYVAVSRGAQDAQLFTNDRAKLPVALRHEVSQQSAHVPEVAKGAGSGDRA